MISQDIPKRNFRQTTEIGEYLLQSQISDQSSPFSRFLLLKRSFYLIHMVETTLFAVNFRGECKLVSVQIAANCYHHLLSQVRNKWSDLCNFSMLGSFPSFPNCCLENDEDLRNISLLLKQSSSSFVAVELSNVSVMDSIDDQSLICSSSSSVLPLSTVEANGEQEEFGDLFAIPCYDVSPILPKKTHLSDPWAEIMNNGVGSVFIGGSVAFREALIKFSTRKGFNFKYKRNTDQYIYVVCNENENMKCDWFIRGKLQRVSGGFLIHKANFKHKCIGKILKNKTKRLNPRIMGALIGNEVQNNSNLNGGEVLDIFSSSYGLDVPYYKAWRSVEAAKDYVYGRYNSSYEDLRWYSKAVSRTNPGSVVLLECNKETHHFERFFVAFKACIDGFRTCRPLLFVDGTFLRGRAKGTLLTATAKDGNNGLFPVALGLVSAENTDNWEWFIRTVRDYFMHEEPIIYISDRNTGILSAMDNLFEKPLHFYCLWHLQQNMKGKFGSGWTKEKREELQSLFTKCAYAPDDRLFKEASEAFKELGGGGGGEVAAEWIASLPVEKWTYAYSPDIKRYGEMTSNATESFNNWILKTRTMPVMRMLDSINQKIAKWFVKRKKASDEWTSALVPKFQDKWDLLEHVGRSWTVDESTGGNFHVKSKISTTVDLNEHTCSCYCWQVQGFPCCHAIAVITRHDPFIYSYVSECFHAKSYRKTYSGLMQPVPETLRFEFPKLDGESNILPPKLNRPAGRPKCSRNTSYGEFPKKKSKTSNV